MVKSLITSTFAVALALCFAQAQAAVYNNKAHAKAFESQAIELSGNFYLTNVKTGKKLGFNTNGGTPNLELGSKRVSIKISRVKGKWFRFDVGTSNKCFSAQWDHDNGINWASTLYRCCPKAANCDNGGNQGPLRYQKQSWLVVPADASSIKKASEAIRKRSHARDFSIPAPEVVDDDDVEAVEETSEEEVEEEETGVELSERAGVSSKKAYYIIAVDHVLDMKTRVINGKIMTSAGRYKSLALVNLNHQDKAQQWRITRA